MDVDDALARLSLEEKAALLTGADYWRTKAMEQAGVPSIMLADGPHGLRKQMDADDHLGLNASEPATCFPTPAALAATWDEALVQTVGAAIGREARAQGVDVVLGPGANIKRDPRCGRNFEYYSEDPWHSGRTAAAFIRGVQSQGVAACLKHFAANNQETDRLRVSAEIDDRALREIYLASFEHAIAGTQPWTVMSSYNLINGTYAGESRWLLTDILRDEWGWDGAVVSDWGAVFDRVATLQAGLDLEMPHSGGHTEREVVEAVNDGRVTIGELDDAVRRVLTLIDRVTGSAAASFDVEQHHALARRAAAAACVLLKNDTFRTDGSPILPLTPQETIAFIGEFARTPRVQGAGSAQVVPTRLPSILDAAQAMGLQAEFAAGFQLNGTRSRELVREACALARRSDIVVLFLGLPAAAESEGYDRHDIELPPNQLELLEAVAAVNPRVVVVLANGAVVTLEEVTANSAAILEAWLGGQGMAEGVLDVLLGDVSPGGKLSETIPHRLEDAPSYLSFPGELGKSRYAEGVFVGYRGYDVRGTDVAYPFGFGLSYTTFSTDVVAVEVTGAGSQVSGHVDVRVTNTGSVAGSEVVQLYVEQPASSVARPPKELRRFAKVHLLPGQSTTVRLTLDGRCFAYWHAPLGRWVVEGGDHVLHIGTSSQDILHSVPVDIAGDVVRQPLTTMSTLAELMADPTIGAEVRDIIEQQPEQFQRQAPDIPAITFVDFNIFELDRDRLDDMLTRANAAMDETVISSPDDKGH